MNARAAQAPEPVEALDEFGNVTIVINHLVADTDPAKMVISSVWSLETAEEALLAQIAYFGAQNRIDAVALLTAKETRAMIATGEEGADVAYVFTVDAAQTNVIIDLETLDRLSTVGLVEGQSPTFLNTVANVVALAGDLKRTANVTGINFPILMYRLDG